MRLRKPFIVKLNLVRVMEMPNIGKIPLFRSLMRLLWLSLTELMKHSRMEKRMPGTRLQFETLPNRFGF